jgi:TPR repeat protein
MADVAHDAAGPVSPKPGDIAPPQASRPDSPDRGRLRVFISYSRDDLDFADQLNAALDACGFECFIDRQGISGGEDWKRRLGNLIREADTVVFVLSPTSARSEICAWEVEEAARLGKRILPVICRPLEGASPPPRLRDLNYIFFHADPKATGSGFGTGLAKLVAALNTDFDWLREHTRYLQRATEWDKGGRPANRLLSGNDIAEARAWAARRPKSAPEPTALHLDFIRASEEEAEARSSAQRKQLAAVAAAQAERETALHEAEEALKQAADAQRRRARIRDIAFVVVSIFAVLAGWLYWSARQQQITADDLLFRATKIITKLQTDMDIDTIKEVFAVFQMGADRDNATSMGHLGHLYADGFGVKQDYAKARVVFEKAAEKGDANSMSGLGWLYASGLGVKQDYDKAREWYEKAADKGDARAMVALGRLYEEGLNFLVGEDGSFTIVPGGGGKRDYTKARDWYEKAAFKGEVTAMFSLGHLYESGLGGERDYIKARDWYENAGDKGHLEAMFSLSRLYENGFGVASPNDARARVLFEKAADKGDAIAMFNLGRLYENGSGVAQDYAKAREWYEKAAYKGDSIAMFNLGRLYENGSGVAQDYAKAREWYGKAADKGAAKSMAERERLPINVAAEAGRYAEALQLQEALALKVEEVETKSESKPAEVTARALGTVAWYALFAREFRKALAVAHRAHALLPDNLMIETNRAHALMFVDHAEESKALYLAHKGQARFESKRWEDVIAQDFAEFRKAGLSHPMMADIEKELGVSR